MSQSPLKRVTVNLPRELLARAQRVTEKGITPTLIDGLKEIEKKGKRSALQKLRGKVRFELDLEKTRR